MIYLDPDTQGSVLQEENCVFFSLRQQTYIGLTILTFRMSLVYVNCIQLLIFSYFFLQLEDLDR